MQSDPYQSLHSALNKALLKAAGLVAKVEEHNLAKATTLPPTLDTDSASSPSAFYSPEGITFDPEQRKALDLAVSGQSFTLTGAAGEGKSFTVCHIIAALTHPESPRRLNLATFRDPRGGIREQQTKPAFAVIGMTNRAVNNNVANLVKDFPHIVEEYKNNFMTFHKLLEYYPEVYTAIDAEGEEVSKMHFIPNRNEFNPLNLELLIIEEASMMSKEHWDILRSALLKGIQVIFLGDINQLPPVFGTSIILSALVQLPVVALQTPHRTATDNPGLTELRKVLKGELPESNTEACQVIHDNGRVKYGANKYGVMILNALMKWHDKGKYNPMEDILILPWNKGGLGTVRMNTMIAHALDNKLHDAGTPRIVHEVQAGFTRKYLAIGDLLYDGLTKSLCIIQNIEPNSMYHGAKVRPASTALTRMGTYRDAVEAQWGTEEDAHGDTALLNDILGMSEKEIEEAVAAASHNITCLNLDTKEKFTYGSRGEVAQLDFGYAITCHKAQGSEWPRVIIAMHYDHVTTNREWLYTAMSRMQQEVRVLCPKECLIKTVARQRIKGVSLDEKIQSFTEALYKLPEEERPDLHWLLKEE